MVPNRSVAPKTHCMLVLVLGQAWTANAEYVFGQDSEFLRDRDGVLDLIRRPFLQGGFEGFEIGFGETGMVLWVIPPPAGSIFYSRRSYSA